MEDYELAFAGVARQADLVRGGEVSSRELVELSLRRIEALDGRMNAFSAVFADRALADADSADARRRAGDRAPLLGVPLGIKDEFDLAGEVTNRGTSAYTTRAPADAEVIRRLRRAGAVFAGRTTMPELGLWPFTESLTFGVTRNPWDPDRTPGGSSGGSAAAVAAGMVPAAMAADGAGSIRIPAACCGLFGLKAQRGRVPDGPHDGPASRWIVFGPLTRTVEDTALVLDAIHGPMPGETTSPPDPPVTLAQAARTPPRRLRVGVALDAAPGMGTRVSAEVRDAVSRTARTLESLGHDVVEADLGLTSRDALVIVALLFRGIRGLVEDTDRPERLERRTRAMARPGAIVVDPLRDRLRDAEGRLTERMATLFDRFDVLLTPVTSRPPPKAQAMEGRGAVVTYLWESGWVPFTVLWNATGLPAASVPAGFTADGLPLGAQLVAGPGEEATLLSLAGQLEGAQPWSHRVPPGCGADAA